jgi:hypothetical protein
MTDILELVAQMERAKASGRTAEEDKETEAALRIGHAITAALMKEVGNISPNLVGRTIAIYLATFIQLNSEGGAAVAAQNFVNLGQLMLDVLTEGSGREGIAVIAG